MKKVILVLLVVLVCVGCQSAEDKEVAEFKEFIKTVQVQEFIKNVELRERVLKEFADTKDEALKAAYKRAEQAQKNREMFSGSFGKF